MRTEPYFSRHSRYTIIRSLVFCFALGIQALNAQNVWIKGNADTSYAGQIMSLQVIADEVTGIAAAEDRDTVAADGSFELRMQADFTQPVTLKSLNVTGRLYVKPDYVYVVTFPAADRERAGSRDEDLQVNLGVIGNDSTELNALIFDFQELYNGILADADTRFLSRPALFKRADSLARLCSHRYKKISDPYFKSYVEYAIATLNASVSRGQAYLMNVYVLGRPVQYRHHEYMKFLTTSFKGYFNTLAAQYPGRSLYNIVNTRADLAGLDDFMKQDKYLKDDSLRELVMLINLWEAYFNPEFSPGQVQKLVTAIDLSTANKEHKRITSSMLSWMNKLTVGSQAPGFSARTPKGTLGSLSQFRGRWVYLNFFSTSSLESMREMPKIMALKKKYGDKVTFLSICVDDSLSQYLDYVKRNPRFNWPIWYNYDKSLSTTAKDIYFVTGSEAYFLISNTGYLDKAPALAPSKGIEYRFNVLFRMKQKTTRTGIR